MIDLTDKLPGLLVIVGVLLQYFVRADAGQDDRKYIGIAAGLCAVAYAVCVPHVGAWNAQIVDFTTWLLDPVEGAIAKVIIGTGTASILANILVKMGLNPQHNAIPVTNSKGDTTNA